jgi:diguanylate cyclase (GGDEF)-like protein
VARALISFLMPGGLLLMAGVILAASGAAAKVAPAVLELGPNGIWAAGILLGWRFKRSRLVFALIVLGLADRALWYLGSQETGDFVRQAAALLVPLNLVIIFLVKERGVMTGRGLWLLLAIAIQPLLAVAFLFALPDSTSSLLNYQLFPGAVFPQSPLAQPPMLALGLALLFFWVVLLWRRRTLENGFFWAMLAAAGAFVVAPGQLAVIFMSTAGLILIVTVIEAAYGMAFRDELTGLPARRALNDSLLRLGNKFTLAMVDIDFFKKFNDKYGHDVGDQVLCMVAAKLSGVTGGGKAFRYGGEEFTIIFPGKAAQDALPHLEKLRETIAGADFIIRGKNRPVLKPRNRKLVNGSSRKVNITVSIGIAAGNGAASPQKVLKIADQALYRAKKNGRNQVAA